MLRNLFVFLSVFFFNFLSAEELPKDLPSLKKLLDERIWQCESHKKLLTDSSDIYTYYLMYGRQSAYEDVIIILDRILIEERNR